MPGPEKKPDMDQALLFLKQVKEEMPDEYDTFLDVLTQFRSKKVEAETIVTLVVEMLVGKEYLLDGFSQFLPPSCRDALMKRCTQRSEPSNTNEDESMEEATTEEKSPPKVTATKRTAFDARDFVGEPPVEPKRRKEHNSEMDLRPTGHLGMAPAKKMTQNQLYLAQLKSDLRPAQNETAWKELERRLEERLGEMQRDPENWIPVVEFTDIANNSVPTATIDRIKVAGVLKIRGSVSKELAKTMNEGMMGDLKSYFKIDPDQLDSYDVIYNEENPKTFTLGGVQEMYYSKQQFEARQNENMHKIRVWLNKLWTSIDNATKECKILPEMETTYIDRWRHRIPKYERQTGMKEHLDNGAMSRWADPAWQQVYKHIMKGDFDSYDPWDVSERTSASGAVFRSFQGWLALSPQGPKDGTLEVIPLLAEAMAYVLLRPFKEDVPSHMFCGVSELQGGETLEITGRWHSALLKGKVPIGFVDAGDSVWWHPDIIHGVEAEHLGQKASNVLYIPATPMCPQNAKYLVKQKEAFISGDSPPGFPDLKIEKESSLRARPDMLTRLGRQQMGMEPFPRSVIESGIDDARELMSRRLLYDECQQILFPDSKQ